MSEEIIRCVKAACEGNTDAMGKLYSSNLRASYYLAYKLSNSESAAVEITQKAYAKAFCTASKLKKPEAFDMWMKQNVIGVFKETQEFTFEDAETGSGDGAEEFLSEDVYEDVTKSIQLLNAVSELKPELRTAVVLHYLNGMPVNLIAKFFGVSDNTAGALLSRAKAEIFAKVDSEAAAAVPVGTLPVLTRVFRKEMENTTIDGDAVRNMFIYALGIFKSFKQVEAVKSKEADGASAEAPTYFSAKSEGNVARPDGEPVIPSSRYEGPSIPSASRSVKVEEEEKGEIDYSALLDEPVEEAPVRKPVQKKSGFDFGALLGKFKGINLKKLNLKKIGIAAAALLAVILIIVGIAKAAGKKKNPENNPGTVDVETAAGYKWNPGGFSDCTDIQYLNEYSLSFKSVSTGKYGLLDYQGNIQLQPVYDSLADGSCPFKRCSVSRDYDNNGNYHSIVRVGEDDFQLIYSAGVPTISSSPHDKHGMTPVYLDNDHNYDERDRFFEGYAAAMKNGKWGYISETTDKKVIGYEYEAVNDLDASEAYKCDYCRPVTGGLVAVKKNGMMGIINLDGDTVVPFEYTNIMPGLGGIFIAEKDGTWGVIATGNAVNSYQTKELVFGEATEPEEIVDGEEGTAYIVDCDTGINVRADADPESEKVGELESGSRVIGYGTKNAPNGNEWLKIKYNGSVAYIAMGYCTEDDE